MIHITLTTLIIFYLLTGLGITEYRVVEKITYGLLTKPTAFILHTALMWPFLLLLLAHIAITFFLKNLKNKYEVK